MNRIPIILIYSRLVIGVSLVVSSYFQINHYTRLAIVLLSAGLLSDILDGIVARRLNVSTPELRRLDSSADQVFFVLVTLATFLQCPAFFYEHAPELGILIGTEALTYVVSFLKFKKEVATHAIASKLWTLILFATLVQIIIQCTSGALFQVCFYVGIATRIEIIAIVLVLREWTTDVPSLYHAIRLRRGKAIRRHGLFNG